MSTENIDNIKPANLLRADDWKFEYQQKSNPENSNLDLITYGTYRIAPGATSDELFHRSEEALLFCMTGKQSIDVEGETFNADYARGAWSSADTRLRAALKDAELTNGRHAPASFGLKRSQSWSGKTGQCYK